MARGGDSTHVSRGLAWIGAASSLVGILDLIAIVVILGVFLDQEQYGIATKAAWLFPILDTATDLGLSAAVIQKEEHDDEAISTVFWINLGIALLLFGVLLVAAPILGVAVFHHEVVGWIIIAYGSKLLWQNIYFIPAAMLKRELRFKELSVVRIIANLAEFAGKIGFAAAGFGVWCFVLGALCRVLVTGIGCQICHPWRPRLRFNLKKAWSYVSFGAKSSASQILFHFYTNIDYAVVGAYFGDKALGAYKLAYDILLDPVRVISNVVVDVAFPIFARLRYERDKLYAQLVSFTRLNLVLVMSFAAVVFVICNDVVALGFGGFEPQMVTDAARVLAMVAVLRSVSFVIPPLLDGIGHPSRTLIYTSTAAIVLPVLYVVAAITLGDELGFMSVAVAWAVGYPIAFVVLVMLAVWTVRFSGWRFARDVIGVPLCIVAATAVGFGVEHLGAALPVWLRPVVTTAVMLLVIGFLLAYTQGLSINAARKALKGAPLPTGDQPGPDAPPPT